jgi:hypothetical protein
MAEQQITALEQIREGDVLMFHSEVDVTEQNPEGSREIIRIDGHIPDKELSDCDPYVLMEKTGNVLPVSVRCPTLTGSLRITKMGQKYCILDTMNTESAQGEPISVKNFIIKRTQLLFLLRDDYHSCYRRASRGMAWHPESCMFGCASMARNPYVIANTIATAKIPWPWHSRQQEQHGQGHVPRVWASVPMADQWPIMRVLRDEKRWCMAHGIPAPSLGPSSVGVPDTDENWFTYSNFDTWWHHLTDHQRLLLWEQRGGSSTWQPPKDFEGEWTGWN